MEVIATKLGNYYYTIDEKDQIEQITEFDYSKYDVVRKKYYHPEHQNAIGIRALYFFK